MTTGTSSWSAGSGQRAPRPVGYHAVGGDRAKETLDEMKAWLADHNAAVMATLVVVFGVKLIADRLPVLGS